MNSYHDDGQARFWLGDCREVLRSLPDESVQMCVTSPPYWGLRDYGTEGHFATFPPDLIKPCILAGAPTGAVVLDPFLGSGTTAMVAKSLGRQCWGIDANQEYLDMAVRRSSQMGMVLD